jgi:hypothetical protein
LWAYFFLAGFFTFGAAFGLHPVLQAMVKPFLSEFGFRGFFPRGVIYRGCSPSVKYFYDCGV